MQQTENYKLNLIETDDVFSPQALNENAQKTEAALTTVLADAQAINAELVNRVATLEARKLLFGLYTGTDNGAQNILLGVTPVAVIVHPNDINSGIGLAFALPDSPAIKTSGGVYAKIIDGGFYVWYTFNSPGRIYHYVAVVQ